MADLAGDLGELAQLEHLLSLHLYAVLLHHVDEVLQPDLVVVVVVEEAEDPPQRLVALGGAPLLPEAPGDGHGGHDPLAGGLARRAAATGGGAGVRHAPPSPLPQPAVRESIGELRAGPAGELGTASPH